MMHEQAARFGQPPRGVRLAGRNAELTNHLDRQDDTTTRNCDELAAKLLEQRERESERQAVETAVAGLAEAAQSFTNRRRELLSEMQRASIELATAIATRLS